MNAKRHAFNCAPIDVPVTDGSPRVRRHTEESLTLSQQPSCRGSDESCSNFADDPGSLSACVPVTELRCGDTSSWGLTVELRATGAVLEVDPAIPMDEHQLLQVIVSTEISWLDLPAVVTRVEPSPAHAIAPLGQADGQRITLAFLEDDPVKSTVLESLIQASHDGSLTVKLVVTPHPQEQESSDVGVWPPYSRSESFNQDGPSHQRVVEPASTPPNPLAASPDTSSATDDIRIQSVHVDFQSNPQSRLCGYQDCLNGLPADAPVVVLSPGYGQTTQAYIALAYHLAAAGFRVLRYDHRNHIGNSSGEMMEARLSSMKTDLAAVVDAAAHTWPKGPRIVLATSLAGRVALKFAAVPTPNIHLLVLLTPILDLHSTLSTVHREDLIVTCLRNALHGSTNILGHALDGARFLDDAMKEGYADFSATLQDGRSLTVPTIMLAAESDTWVDPDDVRHLYAAIPHQAKELRIMPKAVHHLHEDARHAEAIYQDLVQTLCELFPSQAVHTGAIPLPSSRSIERQIRCERVRPHRPPHAVTHGTHAAPSRDPLYIAAMHQAAQ